MLALRAIRNFSRNLILQGTMVLAFSAGAETFRTHALDVIQLEGPFDKKATEISVNDSVAIQLPKDTTFIQGIEINIKVPKEVAEWRDSVALDRVNSKAFYRQDRLQRNPCGNRNL